MINKYVLFAAILSMSLIVGACNTMQGAGEDVKAAGNSLEDSARKNKNY